MPRSDTNDASCVPVLLRYNIWLYRYPEAPKTYDMTSFLVDASADDEHYHFQTFSGSVYTVDKAEFTGDEPMPSLDDLLEQCVRFRKYDAMLQTQRDTMWKTVVTAEDVYAYIDAIE